MRANRLQKKTINAVQDPKKRGRPAKGKVCLSPKPGALERHSSQILAQMIA
jgi:hypothetical protein